MADIPADIKTKAVQKQWVALAEKAEGEPKQGTDEHELP